VVNGGLKTRRLGGVKPDHTKSGIQDAGIVRAWGAAVLRPYNIAARRGAGRSKPRPYKGKGGGRTGLLGLGGGGGGFLGLEVVEELFGFGVVGGEGEGFLSLGAGQREFVLL
jgi:hypothetical protein